MTQGIDMSAAFVPATKCAALSKFDLPLKKMLYLYLRTAAKQNAAVALLVVQVGGPAGWANPVGQPRPAQHRGEQRVLTHCGRRTATLAGQCSLGLSYMPAAGTHGGCC